MLSSRLIWLTETPSSAGTMSKPIRRTPTSCQHARRFNLKRGSRSILCSAWNCSPSCNRPPMITPQARALTGGSNQPWAKSAIPMRLTFSSTGVKAGTENLPQVFNIPAANATIDIKKIYRKVIRVRVTASSNLSGVSRNPGAERVTMAGAHQMPSRATSSTTAPSKVPVRSIRRRVSSAPRCLRYSPSSGTKAWEKAPSANIRRNRLGSLNATKNASVAASAPKLRAMTKSRTKPRIREIKVKPLTVATERSRLIDELYDGLQIRAVSGIVTSFPVSPRRMFHGQ